MNSADFTMKRVLLHKNNIEAPPGKWNNTLPMNIYESENMAELSSCSDCVAFVIVLATSLI